MFKHKRTASKRKRTVKIAAAVGGTAAAAVIAATSAQAIVGGKPTTIDKNSFLVALQFPDKHWCTATAISPIEVVTTSSCLILGRNESADSTTVIVGRTSISGKGGTTNKVVQFWINPNWKSAAAWSPASPPGDVNEPNNDIAVLRLKDPLPRQYKPVKWVPSNFDYKPGITQGRIVGWGSLEANKEKTRGRLHDAKIPILPDAACTAPYKSDYNPDNMVCAGKPEGGVDACYQDVGAPLLISDGKEERLAGLISWGGDCAAAGQPGVYTKVSKFADWLGTPPSRRLSG